MNFKRIVLPVLMAFTVSCFGGITYVHAEDVPAGSQAQKPAASAKTIVLDAGHGGSDPGAVRNGYNEKDLNMAMVKKIAERLGSKGYNVLFTRDPSKDEFISLEDRAKFANSVNADLFISIHHDSSTSSSVNGTSVHYSSYRPGIDNDGVYVMYNGTRYKYLREGDKGFYIDFNGTEKFISVYDGTAYDATPSEEALLSAKLAGELAEVMSGLGVANRGVYDHNLYVTRKTNMVSVLLEVGFISNLSEVKKAASEEFQNNAADRIVQVVDTFIVQNMKDNEKSLDELYREAFNATMKAQQSKNQKDLTEARVLVDGILKTFPAGLKDLGRTLSAMLDKVQQPLLIKTIAAIETARKTERQADINIAREYIVDMPVVWKRTYSSAIDKIQQSLINKTVAAVAAAKQSGDITAAEEAANLYNELLTVTNNDGVKIWAQAVLKNDIESLLKLGET